MFRFLYILLAFPAIAVAQSPDTASAVDPLFLRAQQLVGEGQGAAGRALVDSMLAAAPAGSAQYAEALFWRASLAGNAADAERDYRRLAIEFPLSRRAEDALLRLAQLELARGNRPLAVKHLERLLLEHPTTGMRARANYWMARILFEDGDAARACAALASARAALPPGDIELRNQIAYSAARCSGPDPGGAPVATAAPGPAPVQAPAPSPPPSAEGVVGTPALTVQVSAFDREAPAETLRARLVASGYDARIVRGDDLYRVRVGRYTTRADAVAIAQRLTAQGLTTWITDAEPR